MKNKLTAKVLTSANTVRYNSFPGVSKSNSLFNMAAINAGVEYAICTCLDPSAAADRRIRRRKFSAENPPEKLRRAELAAEFC